jgi:hypothetical protein
VSNWQSNLGSSSPYSSPYDSQPKSSSKLWLWILLGVGGLAGLCCCGGVISLAMFGLNIATEEVANELRDNPKFREHIGELQTLNIDWTKSTAEDDTDIYVYNAKGDKGSGIVTVKHITDDDGNEKIIKATLRLPDGRQVQIVP